MANSQSKKLPRTTIQPNFTNILKSRIKQPQFYWFLGHALSIYHFIRYQLAIFSFKSQLYHYTILTIFISFTYGIVLYQFFKSGQLKINTLRIQLRKLDNLQYFIISIVLAIFAIFTNNILSMAIYSPIIFSIFHCLNYFKENLLPFLPIQTILKNTISNKIDFFITNYNQQCLQLAQYCEIICCVKNGMYELPIQIIKDTIMGKIFLIDSKIILIIIYVYFFKLRYIQNEQYKLILIQMENTFVTRIPIQYRHLWIMYKTFMLRIFDKFPI